MKIYEFSNYKAFIEAYLRALPKKGRGEMSRIAEALDIHTTMVTHVLKGDLHFTLEHALKLAEHWGLSVQETEYFVALVHLERAGDKRAKAFCQKRVDELRDRALNLSFRMEAKNELSEADRARFYSSWIYTYLRLLSATDSYSTAESMAEVSGLPLSVVRGAVEFLLSCGLCLEEKGRLKFGPAKTYIEASSPLVATHHLNWRRKTTERFDQLRQEDLVFTYPVVMAEKDFLVVREKLVQFIEEFRKTVGPSPSEELYCFNLEWLKLT